MYFPELSEDFQALLAALQGKRVAVLGHIRPDGDCIGSQVGLTRMLRGAGIDAVAVNKDPAPAVLASFIGDTPWYAAKAFDPAGFVAVNVDCADAIRIGLTLGNLFPKVVGNIDHHVSNPRYAEINLVDAQAAATGHVLAGLAFDHDMKPDPVAAQALYLAMATDTGQFRLPVTTAQVFELCSRLIACGADAGSAAHELYERQPFARLKLLNRFLDSIYLEANGRISIGILRDPDYAETGANREDAEGFVDFTRDIEGVEVGIYLDQEGDEIKGSLRAKSRPYRMDQLARQFGGGGHAPAAGFNFHGSLEELLPALIAAVSQHLEA
ncbi:MAG: DHH family phosphoesterase [Verrucomicrobiota bacterium]